MQTNDNSKMIGIVNQTIEYKNGTIERKTFKNTILRTGKQIMAQILANEVNDPFDFYVDKMLFGTNGTSGGTPRYVDDTRSGLFGTTLLSKNVIASTDGQSAIFTAVVTFDEAIGNSLNEMALQLENGDLFSMYTFPDLGKTADMQVTFDWTILML